MRLHLDMFGLVFSGEDVAVINMLFRISSLSFIGDGGIAYIWLHALPTASDIGALSHPRTSCHDEDHYNCPIH